MEQLRLKMAGEKFSCQVSTLKSNDKSEKSLQANNSILQMK